MSIDLSPRPTIASPLGRRRAQRADPLARRAARPLAAAGPVPGERPLVDPARRPARGRRVAAHAGCRRRAPSCTTTAPPRRRSPSSPAPSPRSARTATDASCRRSFTAGPTQTVDPGDLHDVLNTGTEPAVSIHAYSPPLTRMTYWATDPGRHASSRRARSTPTSRSRTSDVAAAAPSTTSSPTPAPGCTGSTRPTRGTPCAAGALLVDIRPAAQRAAEGEVPQAVVIERNVLEWRLDPASAHRIPAATGYDLQVVVLCSEGYTSSLAAAALADLGPAPRDRRRGRVPRVGGGRSPDDRARGRGTGRARGCGSARRADVATGLGAGVVEW